MRCSRYKIYGLLFGLLLIGLSIVSSEAKTEYTRTYSKTYPIAADGKVEIENIHGQVNIVTWDRNEVHIVVTVRVDARSEGTAEDVFERISIDFTGDSHRVSARTSIDDRKSNWWFIKSWWDDDDVEIDYEVSMPSKARLDLSHKYGNADLEDFSNDVNVNLKYGDLKIDEVSGNLLLNLSYGNATIAKANVSTADIAYFKLRMNEVNTLNIDSKYSQISIESAKEIISHSGYDGYHLGEVGRMTNEGKYDNIQVEKLDELKIITKYTKVNIENLVRDFSGEMSYGGLEIDRLDPNFGSIDIKSRYTGLEIDAGEVSSYNLDLEGRYLSLKQPSDFNASRDMRDGNQVTLIGHKGSKGAKGMIRVRAEYGGLKLN